MDARGQHEAPFFEAPVAIVSVLEHDHSSTSLLQVFEDAPMNGLFLPCPIGPICDAVASEVGQRKRGSQRFPQHRTGSRKSTRAVLRAVRHAPRQSTARVRAHASQRTVPTLSDQLKCGEAVTDFRGTHAGALARAMIDGREDPRHAIIRRRDAPAALGQRRHNEAQVIEIPREPLYAMHEHGVASMHASRVSCRGHFVSLAQA